MRTRSRGSRSLPLLATKMTCFQSPLCSLKQTNNRWAEPQTREDTQSNTCQTVSRRQKKRSLSRSMSNSSTRLKTTSKVSWKTMRKQLKCLRRQLAVAVPSVWPLPFHSARVSSRCNSKNARSKTPGRKNCLTSSSTRSQCNCST